MKNKKWIVILSIVLVVLLAGGSVFGYSQWQSAKKEERLKDAAKAWVSAIEKQSFDKIPSLVTSDSLKAAGYTKETVVEKYDAIYGGIGVSNMKIDYEISEDHTLSYTATFDTVLGTISSIPYKTKLVEDGDTYKIDWTAELIFPGMLSDDKIRYTVDEAQRGSIIDRNGKPLAFKTTTNQAGVVPQNLGEGQARTSKIANIAKQLGISAEFIDEQLSQVGYSRTILFHSKQ
jgi:penicillin-binding protein